MNIFILDRDQELAAKYHCDKHIIKMPLEQCQLLSSAHYSSSSTIPLEGIYKKTHYNHPCAIWARKTRGNYLWLTSFTHSLCVEYTFRYARLHKCFTDVLPILMENIPSGIDSSLEVTPFAQAMPEQYKDSDPVIAYRRYYLEEKSHLFSWQKRRVPYWVEDNEQNLLSSVH